MLFQNLIAASFASFVVNKVPISARKRLSGRLFPGSTPFHVRSMFTCHYPISVDRLVNDNRLRSSLSDTSLRVCIRFETHQIVVNLTGLVRQIGSAEFTMLLMPTFDLSYLPWTPDNG